MAEDDEIQKKSEGFFSRLFKREKKQEVPKVAQPETVVMPFKPVKRVKNEGAERDRNSRAVNITDLILDQKNIIGLKFEDQDELKLVKAACGKVGIVLSEQDGVLKRSELVSSNLSRALEGALKEEYANLVKPAIKLETPVNQLPPKRPSQPPKNLSQETTSMINENIPDVRPENDNIEDLLKALEHADANPNMSSTPPSKENPASTPKWMEKNKQNQIQPTLPIQEITDVKVDPELRGKHEEFFTKWQNIDTLSTEEKDKLAVKVELHLDNLKELKNSTVADSLNKELEGMIKEAQDMDQAFLGIEIRPQEPELQAQSVDISDSNKTQLSELTPYDKVMEIVYAKYYEVYGDGSKLENEYNLLKSELKDNAQKYGKYNHEQLKAVIDNIQGVTLEAKSNVLKEIGSDAAKVQEPSGMVATSDSQKVLDLLIQKVQDNINILERKISTGKGFKVDVSAKENEKERLEDFLNYIQDNKAYTTTLKNETSKSNDLLPIYKDHEKGLGELIEKFAKENDDLSENIQTALKSKLNDFTALLDSKFKEENENVIIPQAFQQASPPNTVQSAQEETGLKIKGITKEELESEFEEAFVVLNKLNEGIKKLNQTPNTEKAGDHDQKLIEANEKYDKQEAVIEEIQARLDRLDNMQVVESVQPSATNTAPQSPAVAISISNPLKDKKDELLKELNEFIKNHSNSNSNKDTAKIVKSKLDEIMAEMTKNMEIAFDYNATRNERNDAKNEIELIMLDFSRGLIAVAGDNKQSAKMDEYGEQVIKEIEKIENNLKDTIQPKTTPVPKSSEEWDQYFTHTFNEINSRVQILTDKEENKSPVEIEELKVLEDVRELRLIDDGNYLNFERSNPSLDTPSEEISNLIKTHQKMLGKLDLIIKNVDNLNQNGNDFYNRLSFDLKTRKEQGKARLKNLEIVEAALALDVETQTQNNSPGQPTPRSIPIRTQRAVQQRARQERLPPNRDKAKPSAAERQPTWMQKGEPQKLSPYEKLINVYQSRINENHENTDVYLKFLSVLASREIKDKADKGELKALEIEKVIETYIRSNFTGEERIRLFTVLTEVSTQHLREEILFEKSNQIEPVQPIINVNKPSVSPMTEDLFQEGIEVGVYSVSHDNSEPVVNVTKIPSIVYQANSTIEKNSDEDKNKEAKATDISRMLLGGAAIKFASEGELFLVINILKTDFPNLKYEKMNDVISLTKETLTNLSTFSESQEINISLALAGKLNDVFSGKGNPADNLKQHIVEGNQLSKSDDIAEKLLSGYLVKFSVEGQLNQVKDILSQKFPNIHYDEANGVIKLTGERVTKLSDMPKERIDRIQKSFAAELKEVFSAEQNIPSEPQGTPKVVQTAQTQPTVSTVKSDIPYLDKIKESLIAMKNSGAEGAEKVKTTKGLIEVLLASGIPVETSSADFKAESKQALMLCQSLLMDRKTTISDILDEVKSQLEKNKDPEEQRKIVFRAGIMLKALNDLPLTENFKNTQGLIALNSVSPGLLDPTKKEKAKAQEKQIIAKFEAINNLLPKELQHGIEHYIKPTVKFESVAEKILVQKNLPLMPVDKLMKNIGEGKNYKLSVEQMSNDIMGNVAKTYTKIKADEFYELAWSKEKTALVNAPNILEIANLYEAVSYNLVAKSIIEGSKDEGDMLKKAIFWGEVLNKCMKKGDYFSAYTICTGLNISAIPSDVRGHTKLQNIIKEAESLMNPSSSFKLLRDKIENDLAEHKNYIPAVTVYLTDLTFIKEGNPDVVNDVINIDVRNMQLKSINMASSQTELASNIAKKYTPSFAIEKILKEPILTNDDLSSIIISKVNIIEKGSVAAGGSTGTTLSQLYSDLLKIGDKKLQVTKYEKFTDSKDSTFTSTAKESSNYITLLKEIKSRVNAASSSDDKKIAGEMVALIQDHAKKIKDPLTVEANNLIAEIKNIEGIKVPNTPSTKPVVEFTSQVSATKPKEPEPEKAPVVSKGTTDITAQMNMLKDFDLEGDIKLAKSKVKEAKKAYNDLKGILEPKEVKILRKELKKAKSELNVLNARNINQGLNALNEIKPNVAQDNSPYQKISEYYKVIGKQDVYREYIADLKEVKEGDKSSDHAIKIETTEADLKQLDSQLNDIKSTLGSRFSENSDDRAAAKRVASLDLKQELQEKSKRIQGAIKVMGASISTERRAEMEKNIRVTNEEVSKLEKNIDVLDNNQILSLLDGFQPEPTKVSGPQVNSPYQKIMDFLDAKMKEDGASPKYKEIRGVLETYTLRQHFNNSTNDTFDVYAKNLTEASIIKMLQKEYVDSPFKRVEKSPELSTSTQSIKINRIKNDAQLMNSILEGANFETKIIIPPKMEKMESNASLEKIAKEVDFDFDQFEPASTKIKKPEKVKEKSYTEVFNELVEISDQYNRLEGFIEDRETQDQADRAPDYEQVLERSKVELANLDKKIIELESTLASIKEKEKSSQPIIVDKHMHQSGIEAAQLVVPKVDAPILPMGSFASYIQPFIDRKDTDALKSAKEKYCEAKGLNPMAEKVVAEMFNTELFFNESLIGLNDTCKPYQEAVKLAEKNKKPLSLDEKKSLIYKPYETKLNLNIKAKNFTDEEVLAFDNFLEQTNEIIKIQARILNLKDQMFIKDAEGKNTILNYDTLATSIKELDALIKLEAILTQSITVSFDELSKNDLGIQNLKNKEDKTLASIFIQPIQRIPRWTLLLQELIKQVSDPDMLIPIQTAHENVKAAADKLNENKRSAEIGNILYESVDAKGERKDTASQFLQFIVMADPNSMISTSTIFSSYGQLVEKDMLFKAASNASRVLPKVGDDFDKTLKSSDKQRNKNEVFEQEKISIMVSTLGSTDEEKRKTLEKIATNALLYGIHPDNIELVEKKGLKNTVLNKDTYMLADNAKALWNGVGSIKITEEMIQGADLNKSDLKQMQKNIAAFQEKGATNLKVELPDSVHAKYERRIGRHSDVFVQKNALELSSAPKIASQNRKPPRKLSTLMATGHLRARVMSQEAPVVGKAVETTVELPPKPTTNTNQDNFDWATKVVSQLLNLQAPLPKTIKFSQVNITSDAQFVKFVEASVILQQGGIKFNTTTPDKEFDGQLHDLFRRNKDDSALKTSIETFMKNESTMAENKMVEGAFNVKSSLRENVFTHVTSPTTQPKKLAATSIGTKRVLSEEDQKAAFDALYKKVDEAVKGYKLENGEKPDYLVVNEIQAAITYIEMGEDAPEEKRKKLEKYISELKDKPKLKDIGEYIIKEVGNDLKVLRQPEKTSIQPSTVPTQEPVVIPSPIQNQNVVSPQNTESPETVVRRNRGGQSDRDKNTTGYVGRGAIPIVPNREPFDINKPPVQTPPQQQRAEHPPMVPSTTFLKGMSNKGMQTQTQAFSVEGRSYLDALRKSGTDATFIDRHSKMLTNEVEFKPSNMASHNNAPTCIATFVKATSENKAGSTVYSIRPAVESSFPSSEANKTILAFLVKKAFDAHFTNDDTKDRKFVITVMKDMDETKKTEFINLIKEEAQKRITNGNGTLTPEHFALKKQGESGPEPIELGLSKKAIQVRK